MTCQQKTPGALIPMMYGDFSVNDDLGKDSKKSILFLKIYLRTHPVKKMQYHDYIALLPNALNYNMILARKYY